MTMELNDLTARRMYAAMGKDATRDLIDYITAQGTSDSQTLTSPTLTGVITLGVSYVDQVGFFGTEPIIQPAGADQVAVPPPTAQPLTYVGVADNDLGDTGDINENNRLASLANQINNLISDLGPVRTLLNQLQADLVALGLIKGGP